LEFRGPTWKSSKYASSQPPLGKCLYLTLFFTLYYDQIENRALSLIFILSYLIIGGGLGDGLIGRRGEGIYGI
jgi:hypothetical protein